MTPLTLAHLRRYLEQVERVHGPDVPVRVAPLPPEGQSAPWVALVDLLLTVEAGRAVVLLIPGLRDTRGWR